MVIVKLPKCGFCQLQLFSNFVQLGPICVQPNVMEPLFRFFAVKPKLFEQLLVIAKKIPTLHTAKNNLSAGPEYPGCLAEYRGDLPAFINTIAGAYGRKNAVLKGKRPQVAAHAQRGYTIIFPHAVGSFCAPEININSDIGILFAHFSIRTWVPPPAPIVNSKT